jgi:hypothetical protein
MNLSRLNGWQRLWVVLSFTWLVLIALMVWYVPTFPFFRAFLIWAIPSGLLYAGGLAVKWILAGFFRKSG